MKQHQSLFKNLVQTIASFIYFVFGQCEKFGIVFLWMGNPGKRVNAKDREAKWTFPMQSMGSGRTEWKPLHFVTVMRQSTIATIASLKFMPTFVR